MAKAERRELAYFRWKSREWFDCHGRKRCFVEQSTDRDRRLAERYLKVDAAKRRTHSLCRQGGYGRGSRRISHPIGPLARTH